MDKVIVEVSRGIILVFLGYIVAFFILSRVRKRMGARLLVRAQEAKTYDQLQWVIRLAPANSPARILALEKSEELLKKKLEALLKKEDVFPSRDTLLNKYAQEEFEKMIDKIP